MSSAALETLDLDLCINRLASGTLTKTIAAELGIPKPTLRERLLKHPQYAQAIHSQAESIVESAVETMMSDELPSDVAVIARARARVDTAFKYAAARDPANWGTKSMLVPIDGQALVDAAIGQLAGALLTRMRTIDAPEIVDKSEQNSE